MSVSLALQAAAVYALALPLSRVGPPRGRRAVLVAATVLVTLLPLLTRVSVWTPEAPAATAVLDTLMVLQEPSSGGPAPAIAAPLASSPWSWPLAVWAAGAAVALLGLAADLVATRRLARSAGARRESAAGDVAWSEAVDVPVVVGWLRPRILLPARARSWPADRLRMALAHERAHADGRDNLWLLLARLAACVHWFDPLAWLAVAELRESCEQAADQSVLDDGADPLAYAEALVVVARERVPAAGMAMARPSGLGRRVRAVVAGGRPAGRAAGALRVGLLTTLAVGTATASPARRPSSSPVADPSLDAALEAEAERLEQEFHPEGLALIVLDADDGHLVAEAGRGGLLDRPVSPGSVLKPFVVAAALESGVPADRAFPEGDMASILACSSNEGAVGIATLTGRPAVEGMFDRVGLPTPDEVTVDRLALGDGVLITPRAVAAAWTNLSGAGAVPEPLAAQVRQMLRGVVESEDGTGRKAAVPGVHVAGKTGTAKLVLADGSADPDRVLASFVGLVPAEHPRHVVLVAVAGPQAEQTWGGVVAAPSFARIAAALP